MNQQPSTIASYLLVVAKALESKGVDSQALFRRAGIEKAIGNNPFVRVPHTQVSEVFRLSVEATQDPYFGLYASRFMLPSHIHALGTALLSSSTLLEFCQRIERFGKFLAQTAEFYVTEQADQVRFACRLKVAICAETQDTFWSFVLRFMRHLDRTEFSPLRVELVRSKPAQGDQPYREFFDAPVVFDCPEIAYYFSRRELERPLPTASKELAQMNDKMVTNYLAQIDKKDIVAQVTSLMIELMPAGQPSKETVAARLHMSPRTLQVKLTDGGETYQTLLDKTRFRLACGYMENSATSLSEVAYLLGFTDLSSFSRAFKRWSGQSPSDYRENPKPSDSVG